MRTRQPPVPLWNGSLYPLGSSEHIESMMCSKGETEKLSEGWCGKKERRKEGKKEGRRISSASVEQKICIANSPGVKN